MTRLVAIGIGCRRNCGGEAIAALVRRALGLVSARVPSPALAAFVEAEFEAKPLLRSSPRKRGSRTLRRASDSGIPAFAGMSGSVDGEASRCRPPCLFTSQAKAGENGVVDAAAILGMELIPLSQAELEAAAPRCITRSERVEALLGLPSLAEAAALAGAGPASRLILARLSESGASCAVAVPAEAAS